MPAGTNAVRSAQVPANIPTVVDLAAFRERTLKRHKTPLTVEDQGWGQPWNRPLPQYGIQTKLIVTFDGTITYADNTGSITTTDQYPHGLIGQLILRLNGQDRFNVSGIDLKVLEYLRYAAFEPVSEAYPGTLGGGDSLTDGTDVAFKLQWEVPIAADDLTFVGAVFAQASSFNAMLQITQAAQSDLFTIAGDATVTVDGTWHVEVVSFDIPQNAEGALIIPDLSRIHAVNGFEDTFTATGEKRYELVNADAQLLRLVVSARRSATARLLFDADAATTDKIDRIALSHGAQEEPLEYDPAWTLKALNNRHYGGLLPYDRAVIDFVKEDAVRDAVYMQGLTELALQLKVNSGVTVSSGSVRMVQETLI